MLELYDWNDALCQNCIAMLQDAAEVKISREINGAYSIEFTYPFNQKGSKIHENMLVRCIGQIFRIMRVSRETDGKDILKVFGSHIFEDSKAIHLQNVPDFIGQPPYEVLKYAFSGTQFTLLGDSELEALGMVRVDYDGLLIDFFSADKTTPYEVMQTVIENCGKGEIYIDNYNIALVERIGTDRGVRLELKRNMQNVTVERDMTDMITRLYPYGYEDMHIGSVNSGIQYIDSPNIEKYGIREGFKDYSDYKNPEDILSRAVWEFDMQNKERIDVPSVNISGTIINMPGLFGKEINLGDNVIVVDKEDEISERIISLEQYPYEPKQDSVSIGRVKKDLYFYLDQMGKSGRSYNKVSTISGKVNACAISGVVPADGVKVKDSSGSVSILTDMISMSDSSGVRFRCGLSGGSFVFELYSPGGSALSMGAGGLKAAVSTINIGSEAVTASGGSLYINGKKILTEG
ncbi:MAG: prophage endopeptidase tail family protein [Clostridiales bacterium]|nr:prophage endopeptidase tail family protein [Clostridiales bacterium]